MHLSHCLRVHCCLDRIRSACSKKRCMPVRPCLADALIVGCMGSSEPRQRWRAATPGGVGGAHGSRGGRGPRQRWTRGGCLLTRRWLHVPLSAKPAAVNPPCGVVGVAPVVICARHIVAGPRGALCGVCGMFSSNACDYNPAPVTQLLPERGSSARSVLMLCCTLVAPGLPALMPLCFAGALRLSLHVLVTGV